MGQKGETGPLVNRSPFLSALTLSFAPAEPLSPPATAGSVRSIICFVTAIRSCWKVLFLEFVGFYFGIAGLNQNQGVFGGELVEILFLLYKSVWCYLLFFEKMLRSCFDVGNFVFVWGFMMLNSVLRLDQSQSAP